MVCVLSKKSFVKVSPRVPGRHQETIDPFTGAAIYTFGYDGAGRLATVTDVAQNVTHINRDGSGNLLSIAGPFAGPTMFAPDPNGYLASATDPAGDVIRFSYDANGLMQTRTDARNNQSKYTYDAQGLGRLASDQDQAGGKKTLTSTSSPTGFSVSESTSMNQHSAFQTTTGTTGTFTRSNTLPNTLSTSLQFTAVATTSTTVPDGTTTTTTQAPDPRTGFGMLSPMLTVTTKTPLLTSTQSTTRSATFSGSTLATFTEQTNRNGNTWSRVFNASNSTWTTTSPLGRTVTTTVDALDRPTQVAIPKVTPLTTNYVAQGVHQIAQGSARTWTLGYDANGFLQTVSDPLSEVTTYNNDAVGRPQTTVLADNRNPIVTTFDGNSNLTSLQTPLGDLHKLDYTPVDELKTYTPPSLSSDGGAGDAGASDGGAGPWATQYVYDLDRRPSTETRPDTSVITYGFDPTTAQLTSVKYPQGTLSRSYNSTTGQLSGITTPAGEALAYAYDGFLPKTVTWSGSGLVAWL
jgi:YD repeat-containing protein